MAALWAWHCWCIFPALQFNEVRLQPSFLLRHGLSFYPLRDGGPVTTWIYGPLPPFLFLPATFATGAASAMLTAGLINLVLVVGSMGLVCAFWPTPEGHIATHFDRLLAFLLCVAIWPSSSLQFIQADNVAVAFGLVANLVMARSRSERAPLRWLAASLAIAAAGCKQTALGAAVAQLIWAWWQDGTKGALIHAWRLSVCAVAAGLLAVVYFGPAELWFNLVHLPASLPWTHDGYSRFWILAPYLLVHLALPMGIFIAARKRIWTRDSVLLLPALTWFTSLPPGIASLYKLGGSLNSLESLLLFLPPAVVVFVASSRPRRHLRLALSVALIGVFVARALDARTLELKPKTGHIAQAEVLTSQLRDQIWFPWNPIISYYSDRKFYHTEDGILVRFVAGDAITMRQARAYLPPHWSAMALLQGTSDWGLAEHMIPAGLEPKTVGLWTIHSWDPATSPK